LDDELLENKYIWTSPNHRLISDLDTLDYSKDGLKVWRLIPRNNRLLEEICDDKAMQKKYVPEKYLAESYSVEAVNIPKYLNSKELWSRKRLSENMLVVKPIVGGARGERVNIFKKGDEVFDLDEVYDDKEIILLEDFVPSKPIYSSRTKDFHDGCMRYLVDLHVTKKDEVIKYEPIFKAGYWRLSPLGLNYELIPDKSFSGQENLRFKANLAQGAIPAETDKEDLEIARIAIMESVDLIMADSKLI
jgi:hypothetical protein